MKWIFIFLLAIVANAGEKPKVEPAPNYIYARKPVAQLKDGKVVLEPNGKPEDVYQGLIEYIQQIQSQLQEAHAMTSNVERELRECQAKSTTKRTP